MAIYGRTGDKVRIVRLGTLADVKKLDRRKPDANDREAVKNDSYVVVQQEDGSERLYHQAFLRADDGSREITAAIRAVCGPTVMEDDVAVLRGHIETQRGVLKQVLAVLDGGGEFQCGPKGKHLLLREQIRALVG